MGVGAGEKEEDRVNLVENWASVLRPAWSNQKVEPGPALGARSGLLGVLMLVHIFFLSFLMLGKVC